MTSAGETAYVKFGLSGLQADIEFPSDWHEERRTWVRLGFGLFRIAFSFPWKWVVPDEHQCQGPQYGFVFFQDGLHLRWGKKKGGSDDPFTIIGMPWRWNHVRHDILTEPETHPYQYTLRLGEVQNRMATIYEEARCWKRFWVPWRMYRKSINISFDDEVGEDSGTWKGGALDCSYGMVDGETPLDTLRRMESERRL